VPEITNAFPVYRPLQEVAMGSLESTPPRGEGCLLCKGPLKDCIEGLFDTRFGISGKYKLQRCRNCGFEQLFPIPERATLKLLYESYYNFGAETSTLYTKLRDRFLFSAIYRFWACIDGDVSFHLRRGEGRLLDIGCNEGRGLRIYSRNGFQVEGLELNEIAAEVARKAGFSVHTLPLEEFDRASSYDVVVLSNVLEHSLDPRGMLSDIRRVLMKGGKIWISCPNSMSWLRVVFGRSWINWHVPFHISQFSPQALKCLLQDVGYVNIEIKQVTPALWATQSLIARLCSRHGKKNKQLRNPFMTLILMIFARGFLFPILWAGNRLEHGDCLLVTATKG
jgi:SAM-dependent methyltransferase